MESSVLRVAIPQYEEIQEGRVAFKVTVQYAKLSWEVWRRFSDFVALHEQLTSSDYAALPELPPKTLLPSVTDTRFLEKRKNKLFNYIQELLRRPDTRMSEELLNFLCLTEQAAVRSKPVRPALVGSTGPQRFAVSSLARGASCVVAAYEDKTSMSRLGRLWTIVEPDELGMLVVWFLDPSNKFFSSSFTQKFSCKVRAVACHADSSRVIVALDDGTLQSLQLESNGHLKLVASAEIHHSPVVGISGLQGGSKLLSVAADGSIRLVDALTLSVVSGGRLEKRLGGHALTCCFLAPDTLTAYLGTTAGVLLIYSLKTKTPQFLAESRLIPNDQIEAILYDSLGVFVGHGHQVSILQHQRGRVERGAMLQLRDTGEIVHSMALDAERKRLFVGYTSFIAWWCIDRGECLLAWAAHNGGVHQLITQEGGEFLISGGDSGTIKLWQLPASSVLTPWSVHTPQQQFEGGDCCMRPTEDEMAFADEADDHPPNHLQHHQPTTAARHGDWSGNATNRNRNAMLFRRYSSDSDQEQQTSPQHYQQPPQEQEEQQPEDPQHPNEEPPLLVQHQEEESSDEELDDLRSALA